MRTFIRHLVPDWLVNSAYHWPMAALAVFFYRFPAKKLIVIGITGTDGKTTTATLIHKILIDAGKKAALISTVAAKIGDEEIPTGLHVTSPDPWALQKLLREIADKKFEYAVIEATSHGLAQNRLLGCNFFIGAITNVTHEHLDYHKTFENYLAAKAKLFRRVKVAVLNRDDESYDYLKPLVAKRSKIVTYGIKNKADFTPKTFPLETPLLGEYNRYNCLAAAAVADSLGIADRMIKNSTASFNGVLGRAQEINLGQNFRVFIDFAHAPNALKNILDTLRRLKKERNKLIVVFGCAGLRDIKKRPLMGEIAAKHADKIILTAEDPRTEDLDKIIEAISGGCLSAGVVECGEDKGCGSKSCFYRIPDRTEAINFAIGLAKKGDIVLTCGKGHEQSMCFGTKEYPWSEHKTVEQALKKVLELK